MKNNLKFLISSTLACLTFLAPQTIDAMEDFPNLTEKKTLPGMQRKETAGDTQEIRIDPLSKETMQQKTPEETEKDQNLLLNEGIQSSNESKDQKQTSNGTISKKNCKGKIFPLEKTSKVSRELLNKYNFFSIKEDDQFLIAEILHEAGREKIAPSICLKSLTKKIENFSLVKDLLQDSKNVFEFFGAFDQAKQVAMELTTVLETLSRFHLENVILCREKEPDPSFKLQRALINSLKQAIKHRNEAYQLKYYFNIFYVDDKQCHYNRIHGLSLKSFWDIYLDLNIFYDRLMKNFHTQTPDFNTCSNLEQQANISLKMMKFINTYFKDLYYFDYDSKEIQHFLNTQVEENKQSALSNPNKKWKERIILLQSAKIVPMMYHPTYLLSRLNIIYCKEIKGVSFVLDSFATSCSGKTKELYFERSKENLSKAVSFYKKNIYNNEYSSNPEKEEEFILARLDDLVDNPAPLTEFYRRLHQERRKRNEQRIVDAIRSHQEEIRINEKDKARQKVILAESAKFVVSQSKSSDPEPCYPDSILTEKETSINRIPDHTDKDICLKTPQEKKKTRGTADPSKNSIVTQDNVPVEREETPPIYLSTEDFLVFQSLTGGSMDRNITLDRIKKLLTSMALNCRVQTGGNHPKMTAPNGGAWTIPPKWDGPIPAYYRQQLNDFLQNVMEIDPETVFERQTSVNNGKKKNNKNNKK